MEQKVVQIGNSAGVIIPKSLRQQAGLKVGVKVSIKKSKSGVMVFPKKSMKLKGVDVKFMKMVDGFMERHKDVLRELAKR